MKNNNNIYFIVNHVHLDKLYMFDTSLPCRCNTNYLYLLPQYFINSKYGPNNFPILCCLEKLEIKNISDYKTLLA